MNIFALPVLLAAASCAPLWAADGVGRLPVGFQVSLGWVLADDRRFDGTAISFYLSVAPAADVDLGYLREEMYLIGRDNGESTSERGHFDALRVRYRIFDDEIQSARLLASAGYAQFTQNLPVGAFAFDLGAEYVPWKIASGAVTTEFAVQLRYRYCRFDGVEVLGSSTDPVDNGGGFIAGVAGDVRF